MCQRNGPNRRDPRPATAPRMELGAAELGLVVLLLSLVVCGIGQPSGAAAPAVHPAPPGTVLVSHVSSPQLPLQLRSLVGTDEVVATWTFPEAGGRGRLGVVDCLALARLTHAVQGCQPGTTRYRGLPASGSSGRSTHYAVGPRARPVTVSPPTVALQWSADAAGIVALASGVVVSPQDTSIRWIDLGVPDQLIVATGGDAALERRVRRLVATRDGRASVTSAPRQAVRSSASHRGVDAQQVGLLVSAVAGLCVVAVGLVALERSLRGRRASAGRGAVGRR